jgi:Protein of unknown function (DUF2569)
MQGRAMRLRRLAQLTAIFFSSVPALAWDSDTKFTAPFGGAPGALLMWWICSRRKDQPIGGWLLYFYIQLYASAVVSFLLIFPSLKNYNPAMWGDKTLYWLWLISVFPPQFLLLVQVVLGSIMLKQREWKWVQYLMLSLAMDLAFAVLSACIDNWHFPDNVFFNFFTIAYAVVWLLYFWNSVRVKAVFKTHDWQVTPKETTSAAIP